ncbi:cation:proton antiporter [Sphingopyxis terrae]|uniref:Sodium/proton antiporter, CPA1 family n=1 Tax=Sphingopyxis terrae subsp. ummariensis TaxID=429001 RepID=A0A1Y6FUI9_9SPHN|nr:cation:proton antiporter [Sphingopyxis terrae]PCF91353.1 sodium:proton exchanger [Sphingopyxis terrae subsp. ummariensis]SMQ76532.1 sodium/proton antiporter, CPA1 family [Sphingopyxis terrae subsp. ummariensis]
MNGLRLEDLGVLLVASSLVAMLTRRIGLPYTAGLVLAGIALAYSPLGLDLPLSRALIFNIFLPPLIFEAALQLDWRRFRRELPVTLVLAFGGVLLSASLLAAALHWLLGWSLLGAAFFAILIAATDPVSVIAAFKEQKAEPRLAMVVESESLLNDGIAAVGFALLLGIAEGGSISANAAIRDFAWTVLGGIGCGSLVAALTLALAGRTADHLVEITLTTIAAWGSFLFAEHVGASGVFATLVAGLITGNAGWRTAISQEGRPHVLGFWQYAAFLANSCLFLLIGSHEAHQPIALVSGMLLSVFFLTILARAAAVYPLSCLLRPTRLRLPASYQHLLVWGGLRGAVALALALAVPGSVAEQHDIVVLTFGVVACSIFAQGLTVPALLRHWKLGGTPSAAASDAPPPAPQAPSRHDRDAP